MIGIGLSISSEVNSGFDPKSISGCVCWLDAADLSTITEIGGTVVGWADKSGNGNAAVQPTDTLRPISRTRTINGRNALDFDGVDDRMNLPAALYGVSAGNNTVFIVASFDNVLGSPERLFAGGNAGSGRWFVYRHQGLDRVVVRNGLLDIPLLGLADDVDAHVLGLRREGTTAGLRAFYDGALSFAGDSFDFVCTNLSIGGTTTVPQFFNGAFAELIIYNRALTTAEMNTVGNALKTKWGTNWTNM